MTDDNKNQGGEAESKGQGPLPELKSESVTAAESSCPNTAPKKFTAMLYFAPKEEMKT